MTAVPNRIGCIVWMLIDYVKPGRNAVELCRVPLDKDDSRSAASSSKKRCAHGCDGLGGFGGFRFTRTFFIKSWNTVSLLKNLIPRGRRASVV